MLKQKRIQSQEKKAAVLAAAQKTIVEQNEQRKVLAASRVLLSPAVLLHNLSPPSRFYRAHPLALSRIAHSPIGRSRPRRVRHGRRSRWRPT